MSKINSYQTTLLGVLLAMIIVVPFSHYVTIPYMPWRQAFYLSLLTGLFSAPVFLFCTFLVEQVNKMNREIAKVPPNWLTTLDARLFKEVEELKVELNRMVQKSHSFDRPVIEEVEQSILALTKLIRIHFNAEGVG
jgi:hypothetical protein